MISPKYGWTVKWTHRNGNSSEVEVRDHDSLEDAFRAAMKSAKFFGWTEPRWWEWWRRADHPRSERFPG